MKTKEWLIAKRKEKNLSQNELSKKANINKNTIENIEQGKRIGSIETWKKLENFFEDKSIKISYESTNLIEEIENDIKEFGEEEPCILIYKTVYNNIIFTNYDFITDEKKFEPKKELEKDEHYIKSTLKYALEVFKEQNKIL